MTRPNGCYLRPEGVTWLVLGYFLVLYLYASLDMDSNPADDACCLLQPLLHAVGLGWRQGYLIHVSVPPVVALLIGIAAGTRPRVSRLFRGISRLGPFGTLGETKQFIRTL